MAAEPFQTQKVSSASYKELWNVPCSSLMTFETWNNILDAFFVQQKITGTPVPLRV